MQSSRIWKRGHQRISKILKEKNIYQKIYYYIVFVSHNHCNVVNLKIQNENVSNLKDAIQPENPKLQHLWKWKKKKQFTSLDNWRLSLKKQFA